MTFPAAETIRKRKSVRTFDGTPLKEADKAALEAYAQTVTNPFGIPVHFRLLNAKALGLSSPVIVGAEAYLAAKVAKAEHFELAFGYSFEQVCLYAASLGIGTVMLAATLSRSAFEVAMDLGENEVMPLASPVGYPAKKQSVRESLMRKGLKADERKSFETLFFDGSFDRPLTMQKAGLFAEALELASWAPSAGNQQPWRAVVAGNTVHFYERQSLKESALGDVQQVDVGICLCHFELVMREKDKTCTFLFQDPGLAAPEKTRYLVSCEVK